MTYKACGVCQRDPALGYASESVLVNDEWVTTWFCHEGPSPTCYEQRGWPGLPGDQPEWSLPTPRSIGDIANDIKDQIKHRAREQSMTKTDDQVLEDRDDAEMMRRPHLWPNWGVLPLKRRREEASPQIATLEYTEGGYLLVKENLSIMGVAVREVTEHHFTDAEDVLMAGWVVD